MRMNFQQKTLLENTDRVLYEHLGLTPGATDSELRQAYYRLAKKYHPDLAADEDVFKSLAQASAILRDPERRKLYDLGVINEMGHFIFPEGPRESRLRSYQAFVFCFLTGFMLVAGVAAVTVLRGNPFAARQGRQLDITSTRATSNSDDGERAGQGRAILPTEAAQTLPLPPAANADHSATITMKEPGSAADETRGGMNRPLPAWIEKLALPMPSGQVR
jgi:curved DNA-binding protein CbpA